MAVNNGTFYSQTQGLKLSTNSTNRVIVSTDGTTTFTGITSGSTLIDVRGTSGQLMSVTDTLTGPLLTVNNNIGSSIFQVNSNSSIIGGSANTNTFVISGTNVGIGGVTSPTNRLHISAPTNPVRIEGLQLSGASGNTRFLVTDSNGVVTYRTDIITTAMTGNTLYTGNGSLSGNRVVNIDGYTLNFSGSGATNNLVLSGGNVGIGISSPTAKLHVGTASSYLKVTPQWFSGNTVGTWLDLSIDGPSGIGSGGPGSSPWIAYASSPALWFTDASTGDIAYRNGGGKLLFGNTSGNAGMALSSDNLGIGTVSPSNKLHVFAATDPIKVEGVQTSTDTELLTIDGGGVVHKISVSSVGAFLRNETNPSATDTISINQSIFNPSNLTVLSTSTFIVDTNADYYVLGDFYNSGTTIVNGTLKVGGAIYNSGTITGSGIIE
jgi:hypothetical protein